MTKQELAPIREKIGTSVHIEECEALYDLVGRIPHGNVVEVGSANGGSALYLAEASRLVGKKVFCVDPYPESLENTKEENGWYGKGMCNSMYEKFKMHILQKYEHVTHYRSSIPECYKQLPNELSVIFIDGRHDYPYPFIDFIYLYPRLAVGGALAMHDSGFPGVFPVTAMFKTQCFKETWTVGSVTIGIK